MAFSIGTFVSYRSASRRLVQLFVVVGLNCVSNNAWGEQAGPPCVPQKRAEEYCNNFATSSVLRRDHGVQVAKRRCEEFFQAAIQGLEMVCEYRAEASALPVGVGDARAREASGERLVSLFQSYRQRAFDRLTTLEGAWENAKVELDRLGARGAHNLHEELHCEKDGVRGEASGFLLLGLTRASYESQGRSYLNVKNLLEEFRSYLNLGRGRGSWQSRRMQVINRRLGIGIQGAFPSGAGAEEVLPRGAPEAPRAGLDPSIHDVGLGSAAATTAAGSLFHLQAFFRGATGIAGATGHALGEVAIAAPGAAIGFLLDEDKDALALVNLGVGLVMAAAGVSVGPAALAGIGLEVFIDSIRREWRRREYEISEPYYQHVLRQRGEGTSEELARSYRERKEVADYCKKCNGADIGVANYCPAHNEFNPNWFSPSDHYGRLQEWVVPNPHLSGRPRHEGLELAPGQSPER